METAISGTIFEESRQRVSCARSHQDAFAKHWNLLSGGLTFSVEYKIDGTGRIKATRNIDPSSELREATFELGEYLYQLRAALDCLAFSAVRYSPTAPMPKPDQISFPIARKEETFKKALLHLQSLPQELQAWLESIQPYAALDSSDNVVRTRSRVYDLLNDWSRKDRHRRLTILSPWSASIVGKIHFIPDVKILRIDGLSCNLLDRECVLAEFQIATYVPNLACEIEADLIFDAVIEDERFEGPQFGNVLDSMCNLVEHAIDNFETAYEIS